MDVDSVNSLSSGKGKGSSSPRDGCLKVRVEQAHFQRDRNGRKGTGKHSSGKDHGARVRAKVRETRIRGNPKKNQRGQRCDPRCQRLTQGYNIENLSIRS